MDNEQKIALDKVLDDEAEFIICLVIEDRDEELKDYLMTILGLASMTTAQIKERWSSIFPEREE